MALQKWLGGSVSNELHNLYNSDRLGSRECDELIGLARGLLADRQLVDSEVHYLYTWLHQHAGICDQPLFAGLLSSIKSTLSDGFIDDDERKELFDTLSQLTGPYLEGGELLQPTSLPLTKPAPPLFFNARRYCFTGTFMYGQREECEKAVFALGGECASLTKKTDYLVIGTYITESWKHSICGNKILRAVELQEQGSEIAIVNESHWRDCLRN